LESFTKSYIKKPQLIDLCGGAAQHSCTKASRQYVHQGMTHIHEGKQSLNMGHKEELAYGISITDGCISFEETNGLLREMYSVL